jgi:hypothetical protein
MGSAATTLANERTAPRGGRHRRPSRLPPRPLGGPRASTPTHRRLRLSSWPLVDQKQCHNREARGRSGRRVGPQGTRAVDSPKPGLTGCARALRQFAWLPANRGQQDEVARHAPTIAHRLRHRCAPETGRFGGVGLLRARSVRAAHKTAKGACGHLGRRRLVWTIRERRRHRSARPPPPCPNRRHPAQTAATLPKPLSSGSRCACTAPRAARRCTWPAPR